MFLKLKDGSLLDISSIEQVFTYHHSPERKYESDIGKMMGQILDETRLVVLTKSGSRIVVKSEPGYDEILAQNMIKNFVEKIGMEITEL